MSPTDSNGDKFLTRRETEAILAARSSTLDERWAAHHALHIREQEALRLARETDLRIAELHAVAHHKEHLGHAKVHEDEQLAVTTALANVGKERDIHAEAHAKEHLAHGTVHDNERSGIKTALEAVGRERDIHATAHDKEHEGHEREHQLDKLAITKVEQATDLRFASVNEFRGQLNDQSKSFVTQASVDVRSKEVDRRIEDTMRSASEKYEDNRKRIENLEKGDVSQASRGVGQGNVVGWIVGAAAFIATVLGIIIVVANIVTKS